MIKKKRRILFIGFPAIMWNNTIGVKSRINGIKKFRNYQVPFGYRFKSIYGKTILPLRWLPQCGDPFENRWMRIVEKNIQGMWSEMGEVMDR